MSFKDFNFKTFIQEALDEIKFKEPTPVQQKLIPVVRSGRDLVGESKTGSGKTHGVFDIVRAIFQAGRNGHAFVFVQRNQPCCCQCHHLLQKENAAHRRHQDYLDNFS